MASRKEGRPRVGGAFNLKNQHGEEVTEKLLEGKWSLVYFGFTNCPDICPEELDKMSDVVSVIGKRFHFNVIWAWLMDEQRKRISSKSNQFLFHVTQLVIVLSRSKNTFQVGHLNSISGVTVADVFGL